MQFTRSPDDKLKAVSRTPATARNGLAEGLTHLWYEYGECRMAQGHGLGKHVFFGCIYSFDVQSNTATVLPWIGICLEGVGCAERFPRRTLGNWAKS